MPVPVIDWSAFDGIDEMTVTCRCIFTRLKDGDEVPTFQSHVKIVGGHLYTRKPCPDCGRHDNLYSAGGEG